MTIQADLLRGYTDSMILAELAEGDSYGYRMAKHVAAITHEAVDLKEATLYTAFRRLEQQGLIRSRWGDEAGGARRRYYSITDKGRRRLAEDRAIWLETRSALNIVLHMEEEA